MFLNKSNFKYLFIKNENFDIEKTYFDFDKNKDFININYNDILDFEGLYLVTPFIRPINNIKLIDDNKICKKYILEIPLISNDDFYNIFNNLDLKICNFFKNNQTQLVNKNYVNNIKNSNYQYKYNYKNLKFKINTNNCIFYFNDQLFER